MRNVKFRGKIVQMTLPNGEELLGDFAFGNLLTHSCGVCRILTPIYGGLENRQISPNTIGQYTGLTDSNGVEIYEGDILLVQQSIVQFEAVVAWNEATAAFGLIIGGKGKVHNDTLGEWLKDAECKVIGNIYDDPNHFRSND